jgi:hypothetical protein
MRTRFPLHTSSAKKLALDQTSVVTVTSKAFFFRQSKREKNFSDRESRYKMLARK